MQRMLNFEYLLSLKLPDWGKLRLASTAKVLFHLLLNTCQKALDVAIKDNILSAHEAKSALRHHIILNELAAIKRNLEFLSSQSKTDLDAIVDYEEKYRTQVGNRYQFITPPNFDKVKRIPINELYVAPNLIAIPKTENGEPYKISFDEFRSRLFRCVILGDPGAGKSTFSYKMAYDLASCYEDRLFGGKQVTPIHVTIRDYGAAKKQRSCSNRTVHTDYC